MLNIMPENAPTLIESSFIHNNHMLNYPSKYRIETDYVKQDKF